MHVEPRPSVLRGGWQVDSLEENHNQSLTFVRQ